ncbi:MAG TPA: glycoside hydrolase family 2 TIM barrel-domain containing protein, partial [Bryobacteraceae bacterium]|nr:glycoside hydrolase family 2 TIM barrel-domain containing protein [Bryobacteraceae bacterium]
SGSVWEGRIGFRVTDREAGRSSFSQDSMSVVRLAPAETKSVKLPAGRMRDVKLWHFDHPHLYHLAVRLSNGHVAETTFGVRTIETRGGGFYLNGERVRLVGVERMAGSNPEFGMAEPAAWIAHDHADMKDLNCVYTRVHWQQDRRVLDWCDRHGILIQTEVPTWGPNTFRDMTQEPSAEIMNNGLEQLREMIERDRNHPCIFSWGVCNEINGQNSPAYAFAKRMYEEAKRLDPRRLVTYASNSLQKTPEKDVAGLMDYVMWNEYYESWNRGTPADLARNLDEIHRAFPGKAIVISEYGYCACTADRPEGDAKRIDVLREHNRIFRERDYVAGLVFFDYNDYRTHIGDRGAGVMKQRVHGVVDVCGDKKPSWEVLRRESSPVELVRVSGAPSALKLELKTRASVPSYLLRGYSLRAVAYGFGQIPVERIVTPLRPVSPGTTAWVDMKFTEPGISRIRVDVMRPTGFSAWTEIWQY